MEVLKIFWKRKERELKTNPWFEEIQKKTVHGKENHFIETSGKISKMIESAADEGLSHIDFTDYRQEEADRLVHDLRMFGFKAKEVYLSYDYGCNYISVSW